MARADDNLPFLLRYENIARYEDGEVLILDRRVYPAKEEFVRCANYTQVAGAISDMITQSGGPWLAAAFGMVSAARSSRGLSQEKAKIEIRKAAQILSQARPTTAAGMKQHIFRILEFIENAIDKGDDPEAAAYQYVISNLEKRYLQSRKMAAYAVDLLPNEVTMMTQCYAETIIGFIIFGRAGKRKKNFSDMSRDSSILAGSAPYRKRCL